MMENVMIDLERVFDKHNGEYLKFARIKNPPSKRRDVCAFVLLDSLVPGDNISIISSAEHDIIYLDIDQEKLANAATIKDIVTLIRCGIFYSDACLAMFV